MVCWRYLNICSRLELLFCLKSSVADEGQHVARALISQDFAQTGRVQPVRRFLGTENRPVEREVPPPVLQCLRERPRPLYCCPPPPPPRHSVKGNTLPQRETPPPPQHSFISDDKRTPPLPLAQPLHNTTTPKPRPRPTLRPAVSDSFHFTWGKSGSLAQLQSGPPPRKV